MPNVSKNLLPPQDLNAEMSVLGALLLDNTSLNRVLEVIRQEDFYREAHRKIFKGILTLSEMQAPCDLITLSSVLRKQGVLEEVGGASYLAVLVDYVPTSANVVYYSKIVKEKATHRKLIAIGNEISARGHEDGLEASELLEKAQKDIFEIFQDNIKTPYAPIQTLLKDAFKNLKELHDRKEDITGVPSGLVDLDNKTAGFQAGDLVIVAARPSMGKTALALNIVQHASAESKKKVPAAIFSLEMSKEQLTLRFLTSLARIDYSRVRTGRFFDSDWPKLMRAADTMHKSSIFIDDTPSITIQELRAKSRRLKQEHNIGMIVVDYLQLMRAGGKPESRQQEISEISRSLKALAKELQLPVIALSQLNRDLEKRGDKRPMMSDLRESGAIEQDADLILFIYRDSVYCEDCRRPDLTCSKGHDRDAELIIGKQRNGSLGTIEMIFTGEHARFENKSKRQP